MNTNEKRLEGIMRAKLNDLKEAKQRIAELERALEYYADYDNYKLTDIPGEYHKAVLLDNGRTARTALKREVSA